MPATLYFGSTGQAVRELQEALNRRSPTSFPRLHPDGIFGAKTLARVKEFQSKAGLSVDGIVGPMTWGALESVQPSDIPPRQGIDCGTSDPGNNGLAQTIRQQFVASRRAPPTRPGRFLAFGQTAAFQDASNHIRLLSPAQQSKATAFFGGSLDFSRIFISNKTGLGNRPFTMAFPDTNQIVQIINCGTFTPSDRLLIHELTHVWQSQHHSDQFQFMANAAGSQGQAVKDNAAEVFSDPDVLLHKDHPVQFPFSAYAYQPGRAVEEYAAEQMANAMELGEASVRSHVRSVALNAVDTKNETALSTMKVGDRRVSGVKF
jgi:hypothetical protein